MSVLVNAALITIFGGQWRLKQCCASFSSSALLQIILKLFWKIQFNMEMNIKLLAQI